MYEFVKKTAQITHPLTQQSLLQQGQKGGKYFKHWKRANVLYLCVKYKQCSSLSIKVGLLHSEVMLDLRAFLEIY